MKCNEGAEATNLIAELMTRTSALEAALDNFEQAADALDLPGEIRSILRQPERIQPIRVPVRMGGGRVEQVEGTSVAHNTARGPARGGILYHPDVTPEQVRALAMSMTWAWAVADIPLGGGKGGVAVDLKRLAQEEQELCARETLVIAPRTSPAAGRRLRETAGRTLRSMGSAACEHLGFPVRRARVVVQGFGNAGSAAALHLAGARAIVTGASDTRGAVYNAHGLDIPGLIRHKERSGSVVGFSGAEPVTGYELLTLNCDILVAAAAERAIHGQNAHKIQAKIIAEAAGGAVTPTADRILGSMGVFVIPDSLCGAGGDIVSYYEWMQYERRLYWDEQALYNQLELVIDRSFQDVLAMSFVRKVNMRKAAHMLGISRVAESIGTAVTAPVNGTTIEVSN